MKASYPKNPGGPVLWLFIGILCLTITSIQAQEPTLNMPPPPGTTSSCQFLCLALAGAVFGLGGQLFRAVIGFKEEIEKAQPVPSANPPPKPEGKQPDAGAAAAAAAPPATTSQSPPRRAKWSDWFDPVQFWMSLGLGAVAGAAAAFLTNQPEIGKSFVTACFTAGYAGSDFLEGLMSKAPATGQPPPKNT